MSLTFLLNTMNGILDIYILAEGYNPSAPRVQRRAKHGYNLGHSRGRTLLADRVPSPVTRGAASAY